MEFISDGALNQTIPRPLEVHGYGGTMIPNHRTICSIAPVPLRAERPYNGIVQFNVPAVTKGKYVTLRVYDTQQFVNNPMADPPQLEPRPITATQVGECLVREWTRSLGSEAGGSLGVALIGGDEPTQEELDRMAEAQTLLSKTLHNKAEQHYAERKWELIPALARVMTREWLGYGAAWLPEMVVRSTKNCPACADEMASVALRCKGCGTDLPKWYAENRIPPDEDEAVVAFIERRLAAKNAAAAARVGKTDGNEMAQAV